MSSYREVRKQMADQKPGDSQPCAWCNAIIDYETLCKYGARCFACYKAYLREPQSAPDIGDKSKAGPKDWARALKVRDEAGEKLSPAQKDAYRAALQSIVVTVESSDIDEARAA